MVAVWFFIWRDDRGTIMYLLAKAK